MAVCCALSDAAALRQRSTTPSRKPSSPTDVCHFSLKRAPDLFGSYLALGLTIMLATQTLVNIGVVTGALPTKGLPLPFISFGGSALLMTMFSAGVLLNISQHASHA